jgi:alcohol dehydrogenase class IV
MLVVDRGALGATHASKTLNAALGSRLALEFDAFTPNPASEQPAHAARVAAEAGVDAVVAFGGGSCIDVAKVAALSIRDPGRASEHSGGADPRGSTPVPVLAIPTTSGTGSETTHFASVYVHGRKHSVLHPGMRPWGVVLDTSLHMSMPAHLAACTGLDVLCHSVESQWASHATPASIVYAEQAGAIVREHLATSVALGTREARELVMVASHLAGRAINASKTTASHALSYEITTRTGTPHGLAAALTLGHVARVNACVDRSDCNHPGGVGAARHAVLAACTLLGTDPEGMAESVWTLLRTLSLPSTLREVGVDRTMIPAMAAAADPTRLGNNPRRLTESHLIEVLEAAM